MKDLIYTDEELEYIDNIESDIALNDYFKKLEAITMQEDYN